jgi:predicted PurR-regulated permease PerM
VNQPPGHHRSLRAVRIASYILMGAGLVAALLLHLMPTLLAGLLVYELVSTTSPLLGKRLPGPRARMLVVALIASVVVGLLVLAILGGINLFHRELGGPGDFFDDQLMPLIERARTHLPESWVQTLPGNVDELRLAVVEQLRKHAVALQAAGRESLRVLVHVLIGLVLGAIVSLTQARPIRGTQPLAMELAARCRRLARAFHDIVFAQVRISLVNAAFTALFLLVVLPLFGVHMPLAKTLVAATFIAGLVPVVGNLVSNTMITVIGLSVSLEVAAAALGYLIVIHKLEYFLNARIVGERIRASAWELLVAMVVMEAAFGIAGVVAAPIFYAYLKGELKAAELV